MSLLSANAIRKVWVVQFDSVFSVYTLSINFRKLRITTSSFFYTSLCTYLTIACRTCETSQKHFILPLCKLGLNPLLPSLVGGRGNRPHSRESDEKIETRVLYSRMERILEKFGRLLALYHCAPFSRAIAGLGLHSKLVHSLAISWNVWIHGHFSDRVLCTSYENTKQTKKNKKQLPIHWRTKCRVFDSSTTRRLLTFELRRAPRVKRNRVHLRLRLASFCVHYVSVGYTKKKSNHGPL